MNVNLDYIVIVNYNNAVTNALKICSEFNGISRLGIDTVNNKLGVLNPSRDSDILLVIKKEVYNSINLDYLTGVFNLTKVDLIKNIIVVDGFQTIMKEVVTEDNTTTYELAVEGEDLDFIILDTRGMDNHVALQDGGLIYNPEGKYTNHYYNLWKIVSFKQFTLCRYIRHCLSLISVVILC